MNDSPRLVYVRYADDWLCGVIGSKEDCKKIKEDFKNFLKEQLQLELSEEKTLITNAQKSAKFLSYEIRVRHSNLTKRDKTGKLVRNYTGRIVLEVSSDTIRKHLIDTGAMKLIYHNGKEIWKPKAIYRLKNCDDLEILDYYNSMIRGFYNYYCIANNSSIINSYKYIMEYSMYKTYGTKYRTSISKVIGKFRAGKDFAVKFHNYSFNNTLLITMQKPEATLVAGYQAWQKKFNRHVKRGEKGIQIIAPAPIREKQEIEKIDPVTKEPVIGDDGQPETEIVEMVIPRFRVTTVFDVSQTEGEPIAELEVPELTGSVQFYDTFMEALQNISPVPIRMMQIEGEAKGYYHQTEKYIAIQEDMSNLQTMKTGVHEVSHALLHDQEVMDAEGVLKDQTTKEVEAESIAYIVCNHFGLDTSEYSFTYIASWCESKDMKALRASMDTIRKTSAEVIGNIETQIHELEMERPIEDASLENIEETAMQYAHRLIEAAEDASRGNFTDSQRNLIVNFAYKMDDKDEVLGLVNRMMTAIRRPGSEYTRSLMNETQAQIDNFPDGMIGFTEMHEAGIRLEHMYPLEKNRAVELYREGAEVFLLHGNPDNPEQAGQILAETENAILGHDGIFGITEAEWEVHKEREAAAARQEKLEQDSAEKIDETLLLHGESRRFAIYQMDSGDEHTYQFMGIESAKSLGYTIDGKDYRMVYAAPWMPTITLDNIFERFNIDRPEDFRGHSLSVSDVIVINRGAEITAYYVDSFGFQKLPEFVQQRMNILEHNSVRAYPPVYKGTLEALVVCSRGSITNPLDDNVLIRQ